MATKTNITINGRDYFRMSKTIDGQRKYFYGTSKGNAEKKYEKYVEELARLKYQRQSEYDTATFHDRADQFINDTLMVSQKYAEGTKARYESSYRCHVAGSKLDNMKVCDVKPSDIQKFYNSLEVSQQTLKAVHKFISAFNKWLIRNNYSDDFLSAVELPKKEQTKKHEGIVTWSEDEVDAILRSVARSDSFRLSFLVIVLLYAGVRISEAISLRYTDIEDNIIHIKRQYYLGEIKPPKYNSVRDIPAHEKLLSELEIHRAWHNDEMKIKGYKTDYIFTTSNGNLYSASSIRKQLVKFCRDNEIQYKHIHAYRATFCTQMCRCGVPLEVTSALMGHKNLEVTAAHYALVKQDTKEFAIASLKY